MSIGQRAVIEDHFDPGVLVEGECIDHNGRCRLKTGEYAGEVRFKMQYTVIELCERGEAPGFIAAAWGDMD